MKKLFRFPLSLILSFILGSGLSCKEQAPPTDANQGKSKQISSLPAIQRRDEGLEEPSASIQNVPMLTGNTSDPIIHFPDSGLEARVRLYIRSSEGEIRLSDLKSLTYLQGVGEGISDLSGIEHCTALPRLELGKNQISELRPLRGLHQLTELDLYGNRISELSPLAGLINLKELSLASNQIRDLAALKTLTRLDE